MTLDASKLGWGSWIMYAVKVIGLVYLAMYSYIRFDDPDTKRILQQTQIDEIKTTELLAREKEYSQLVAVPYAKAMAIKNIQAKFKAEHNQNIEDVIGKDWVHEFLSAVELPVETQTEGQPSKPKGSKAAVVLPPHPILDDGGLFQKVRGFLQTVAASKNPTIPQTPE